VKDTTNYFFVYINYKPIYLHSQAAVAGVYQKNGFKIVGGSFVEADILHYFMQYLK